MLKKKKVLVGALIVLAALGVLGYMGFQSSATYYYTVSEVLAQGNAVYERDLRIGGKIAEGSIDRQDAGSRLRFAITDGQKEFPVTYQGVIPDAFFQPEAEVVVEGRLGPEGVFQARTLLAKCPSRYVAEE